MMAAILMLIFISVARTALRVSVNALATALGVALELRSRRCSWRLLNCDDGAIFSERANRRLQRKHLKLAIAMTDLSSLLPGSMARARLIANAWESRRVDRPSR